MSIICFVVKYQIISLVTNNNIRKSLRYYLKSINIHDNTRKYMNTHNNI